MACASGTLGFSLEVHRKKQVPVISVACFVLHEACPLTMIILEHFFVKKV